jgi:hypothetical protein
VRPGWRLAFLGLLAAAPVGCGSSSPPAAATVRGLVTFQGQPLVGGVVVFAPDRERGTSGKPATATVAQDGSFRLTGDGGTPVPPGWYRVAVADRPGSLSDADGSARFPTALRRPDRSGLEREVLAGRDNVFVFQIEVADDGYQAGTSR